MKTTHVRTLRHMADRRGLAIAGMVGFLLGSASCSGPVLVPGSPAPSPGAGGTIGETPPGGAGGPLDPGTVAIHRLNALEYDNTVNDLLGLQQNVAETTFIPDEIGANGFNNEADAFTMTDAELSQYFNSAQNLGEAVAANPTLWSRIVTCTPTGPSDQTCLATIINSFGARAYRRPLTADEVTQLEALAADAVTNGEDFNGEVKQIVKAMLASPPFLYRIESDADPASTTPHPLGPYELAARLSYLLWSSMPDATLFADAASGAITGDATLLAELNRMLASPKAAAFTSSFAGQWLGFFQSLSAHQVEPTAFPSWNEDLRLAMTQEMQLYFGEFLNDPKLPWTQFMSAPMNFVNGTLAAFYGFSGIPAAQTTFTKVMNGDPTGTRVGFMGLGGFLTETSYSYRTSPTERGKWVLLYLLGENIPSPPPGEPPIDVLPATDSAMQGENVRARLIAHRANAACAACHTVLDPIGLALESFDGIGHYRTTYGDGEAIDTSGMLPDGTTFKGLASLAQIMSKGRRLQELLSYTPRQVLTYATSRQLEGSDEPYLALLGTQWASQNYSMRALVRDVVLSDPFRQRHGGI